MDISCGGLTDSKMQCKKEVRRGNMKFEVEVYIKTGDGDSGCEIVRVDCRNRAEAEIYAEQTIRGVYTGPGFRITRIVPKVIREVPHAISPSDPNNDFPFWFRITDPRNLFIESQKRGQHKRLYRIHEPNGGINELNVYDDIARIYHIRHDTVANAMRTGKMLVRGEEYRVEVIDLERQGKEASNA